MAQLAYHEGRNMKRYVISVVILALAFLFCLHNLPASTTDPKEEDKQERSSDIKENIPEKPDTSLTWYKYDEGLAKAKKEKKHVVLHFYTNWCGWCKRMDKQTFADQQVRRVLNEDYVTIRVNGQSGENVSIDGKDATERQVAGMYGVRAYPITWFLKPSGERIAPKSGYCSAEEFLYILNWVKDDLYEKMSFQEFVQQEQNKTKSGRE
jgi:thioredoxin-related protein